MKLGNSGKCPDDVPDNICHPPVKSYPKSHSHVICRSSACHPCVVRMRLQSPKYFQLNTRATALLKMNMIQTTFWLLDVYLRWNLPSRTLDFRVMRDYDVWSNSPTPPSPIKIKTNLVDTRETYQRRRYLWYLYSCGIWAHWDRKFHTLYSFGWERVKFVFS